MKSVDSKKLLSAIDAVHQSETWEDLGAASPAILDDLIGADFSSWNVFNQQGALVEVFGTEHYTSTVMTLVDPLNAHMAEHPVIQNTALSTGQIVEGPMRLSDYSPQKDFESTGLYQEAYRHLDAKYQASTQVLITGGIEVAFSSNRRLKNFNDDSLELLEGIKKHYSIACRRLLRERELKERIELLMDHTSAGTRGSMALDHNGVILETTGEVVEFLKQRFRSIKNGLPTTLRRFLSAQVFAIEAGSRTFDLKDDFGGSVKVTLMQTGFGTRWTLLFHGDAVSKPSVSPQTIATMKNLSQREHDVLQWIAEGKTNPEISILLNIAVRTVEKHCENIYQKLGVENRIAAAREWLASM